MTQLVELEHEPPSTVICRPTGDLEMVESFVFRHVISDLLQPGLQLEIDLRHVGRIDAVGLSALVGTVRRVRAVGGGASITNASPRVQWCLDLWTLSGYGSSVG